MLFRAAANAYRQAIISESIGATACAATEGGSRRFVPPPAHIQTSHSHRPSLSISLLSLSLSLLTLHPTDGQRSGAAQEATSVFRSKKIDIAEAYQILGVNEKTPWEEVLKVRSCVRANNRIRAKMRHR